MKKRESKTSKNTATEYEHPYSSLEALMAYMTVEKIKELDKKARSYNIANATK